MARARNRRQQRALYDAFLSYSHSARDSAIAEGLQRTLHSFGRPLWALRALRIYRDRTNLTARPDLWGTIEAALDDSQFFILLASPTSAESRWVRREMEHWLAADREAQLVIVLTGGSLVWDHTAGNFDISRSDALPPALLPSFRTEPLWLDLTWIDDPSTATTRANPRFLDVVATISATIQGRPKDEIAGEDVRQLRRGRRLAGAALAMISAGFVAATFFAFVFLEQRDLARSRQAEVERQLTATLAQESRALSAHARRALDEGDTGTALLLALRALPNLPGAPIADRNVHRPLDPRALRVAREALWAEQEENLLGGHGGVVWEARFDPAGARVVTAADDGTARIWDPVDGRTLTVLEGHTDYLYGARFSPDGRFAVTHSPDGTVRLWDAANGTPRAVLDGHEADVSAIAIDPRSRQIATGSDAPVIRLWDLATGRLTHRLDAVRGSWPFSQSGAAYGPDGTRLATGSLNGSAQIWDTASGRSLAVLSGHSDKVLDVAFSPDGRRVATASADRTVRLWAGETGAPVATLEGHEDGVYAVTFSPDGARLASRGFDGSSRLWDVATGTQIAVLPGRFFSFSPDGRRIVTGEDKTLVLSDGRTGGRLGPIGMHFDIVMDADFDIAGERLVSASRDSTARVWSLAESRARRRLGSHDDPVARIDLVAGFVHVRHESGVSRVIDADSGVERLRVDGRILDIDGERGRVASVGADGATRLQSLVSGEARIGPNLGSRITGATFSPNGMWLALSGNSGEAVLWPVSEGGAPVRLDGHTADIYVAGFSPDGRYLLTADAAGEARLWDVASGALHARLEGHGMAIWIADFSPDGRSLVTGSEDDTARIWRIETGAPIATLAGHESQRIGSMTVGALSLVAFSPDGKTVLTASPDGSVRLWDADTGARRWVRRTIERGSFGPSPDAEFTPDGLQVVIATPSSGAALLDAETGDLVRVFSRGIPSSRAILSPDGRVVVTGSAYGVAQLWETATGELLGTLPGIAGGVEALSFGAEGERIVTRATDGSASVWRLFRDPAQLIGFACANLVRDLTPMQRNLYGVDTEADWPCLDEARYLWPNAKR